MTAPAQANPTRIEAGNGWSVERRSPNTWAVIDPDNRWVLGGLNGELGKAEEAEPMDDDIARRLGEWLTSHDTGLSSEAIAAFMLGARPKQLAVPHDKDDAGRCVRLLNRIPEWRARMGEIAAHDRGWAYALREFPEILAASTATTHV